MLNALARYADWFHLQWPAGTTEPLPRVDDRFRTNLDGVYVVGDLAGVPLLKFSVDGGARAVQDILAQGIAPVEPTGENGPYDIVIIGAGASGMAAARRDLLSIDPNRAGIRSPSAKGVPFLFPAVALSGETGDFLVKDLLGQQASHLCVVLDQVELCVDRAVETVLKRLGTTGLSTTGLSSLRLVGVSAMLRIHNQGFFDRGSSSVIGLVGCPPGFHRGRTLLCAEFQ